MRVVLSPYAHELHWSGTGCAEDCPACKWVRESQSQIKTRRVSKKKPVGRVPPEVVVEKVVAAGV